MFVRFTKLIIEHFLEHQPKYIKRLRDRNEPKDIFNKDYKIAFVKTTRITTKLQGKRLPDHFLDDKIRKTMNYELYEHIIRKPKST